MNTNIKDFKFNTNVSLNHSKLKLIMMNDDDVTKEPKTYIFGNMEQTMMKYNMFCNIQTKTTSNNKNEQFLYIMKIYTSDNIFTNLCKIGISTRPTERCKTLNQNWIDINFNLKLHKISNKSSFSMNTVEKAIHSILIYKNLKYNSTNNLDGMNELFSYEEWIDELI